MNKITVSDIRKQIKAASKYKNPEYRIEIWYNAESGTFSRYELGRGDYMVPEADYVFRISQTFPTTRGMAWIEDEEDLAKYINKQLEKKYEA